MVSSGCGLPLTLGHASHAATGRHVAAATTPAARRAARLAPAPSSPHSSRHGLRSLQPSSISVSRRCTRPCHGKLCVVSSAAAAAAPFPQQPAPSSSNGGIGNRGDFLDQLGQSWGDAAKENERKKLRTVFDFDSWRRHRSSSRYLRHMLTLGKSRTMKWVLVPMAYVMSVALAVALYHVGAEAGMLPAVMPGIALASSQQFGLTSFALSTLLVLRTNTSYTRWDEARKMWGGIVNSSRDLVRQALAYIPAAQADLQDMYCRWVVAYCRSLMCHLRDGEDLERELTGKLMPEELKALLASQHRPNYTLQVLTTLISRARLAGSEISNRDSMANVRASAAFRMDENLSKMSDATGGCERILRTPVPLAYTRHNSRFLMFWLTLLPFALWESCRWAMLPVTAIISFLLLGVKEIGVTIEEPFSILPLEVICDTIEKNVWELHDTHSAQSVAAQQGQQDGSGRVDAMALVDMMEPGNGSGNGNGNGNGNDAVPISSNSTRIA